MDATIDPPESMVFHPGEQLVQDHVGVRERIDGWASRVVRPYMPEQHREFFEQLPFLVAAARDAHGRPWVTLLAGAPGFVRAPDAETLSLAATPAPGDALDGALGAGTELGLLGIDLGQRRRNRVNGTLELAPAGTLRFRVGQSFGNCPQYITERPWHWVDPASLLPAATRSADLDSAARDWIASADTFFIGSGWSDPTADRETGADRRFGMDASHRGGRPGFVEVVDGSTLRFPDYAGNHHYNTLGNLMMDPRVALTLVDFERGALLQLTGRARVDLDPAPDPRHPGALRMVEVDVTAVVRIDAALPLRWDAPVAAKHDLRVIEKVRESEDVTSFVFESQDGTLPSFTAGQHLPLEFAVEGADGPVVRTYSLSGPPGAARWRISVKREPQGLVSRFLHDNVDVGDRIGARPPAGDFVLHPGRNPVVMVSAGVGVTPMLSMLHALVEEDSEREAVFVHGARDGAHHTLAEEARTLVGRLANGRSHVTYSQPRDTDLAGRDYDARGRVDAAALASIHLPADADVYLCGPTAFLAGVSDALAELGFPESRVHAETFGPSAG